MTKNLSLLTSPLLGDFVRIKNDENGIKSGQIGKVVGMGGEEEDVRVQFVERRVVLDAERHGDSVLIQFGWKAYTNEFNNKLISFDNLEALHPLDEEAKNHFLRRFDCWSR